MTTQPIPGVNETRTQATSRRIRGLLAENRISQRSAARAIGMDSSSFNRRVIGEKAWSISEVEVLSESLGLDLDYLLTGIRNPHQGDPGGGEGAPSRARTGDLRIKRAFVAPVVPLFGGDRNREGNAA